MYPGRYEDDVREIAELAKSANLPFMYVSDNPDPPYMKNIDAMWGAIFSGRPTLNGYSGNDPQRRLLAASTPPEDMPDTGFLKNFSEPYLLIMKTGSSFQAFTITDPAQLADIGSRKK